MEYINILGFKYIKSNPENEGEYNCIIRRIEDDTLWEAFLPFEKGKWTTKEGTEVVGWKESNLSAELWN